MKISNSAPIWGLPFKKYKRVFFHIFPLLPSFRELTIFLNIVPVWELPSGTHNSRFDFPYFWLLWKKCKICLLEFSSIFSQNIPIQLSIWSLTFNVRAIDKPSTASQFAPKISGCVCQCNNEEIEFSSKIFKIFSPFPKNLCFFVQTAKNERMGVLNLLKNMLK